MNSNTATSAIGFDISRPAYKKNRAFLQALETIEYGKLTLITPDGNRMVFAGTAQGPVADWQIYDWRVFDDFIARGEFGFADTYIDGRWTSRSLEALITFGLMNTDRLEQFFHGRPFYALWLRLKYMLLNNSVRGSRRNVVAHYDLGNNFYKLWLDKGMTYSCGLFEGDNSRTLEDAQQAKYDRILRKLDAKPGQHILEIGCGWGGFAEAAAKQGVYVTAITLASTQAAYARARFERLSLDHLASVELVDYRKIDGIFDHIVSIGMFEHVGERYWPVYFDTIRKCLKPGGKAMVQTITLDDEIFEKLGHLTGVIEYYIFPGGMLPSRNRFLEHAKAAGLHCRETYAFGQDYAITLAHWLKQFEAQLPAVRQLGYDERFIRLWRFYLASCIASFKSRRTSVMQAELTHL